MFEGKLFGHAVPGLILAIERRNFSGQVIFEYEGFSKTVFFWKGHVASAQSQLIDDRLGEVLYREGLITLDKFEDTAGKVRQGLRFGDILVGSGYFSPGQLWDALKLQSESILQSLCFYDSAQVKTIENHSPPRNEFSLQGELQALFDEAQAELALLEWFHESALKSPFFIIETIVAQKEQRNFYQDLIGLIHDSPCYQTLVEEKSRLSQVYTQRALLEIYCKGLLQDHLGIFRTRFSEGLYRALESSLENAHFMLAELARAAENEHLTEEWNQVIADGNSFLSDHLGVRGHYLETKDGFKTRNILRSYIYQEDFQVSHRSHQLRMEPDGFVSRLDNILYDTLLFLFFQLSNKRPQSAALSHGKKVIDEMKHAG